MRAWILAAALCALICSSAGAAPQNDNSFDRDRVEAARKRLEERQRAAREAAAKAATRPTTKPTTQAAPAHSRRVAFVIDGTGSMLPHLEDAKVEIQKALRSLPADQEFALVAFHDQDAHFFLKRFAHPTDAILAAADKWLEGLNALGSGDPVEAVRSLLQLDPDVIWLVSDGDYGSSAVPADIRKANSRHVPIRTVLNFVTTDGNSEQRQKLVAIAFDSGGACYDKDGKRVENAAPPPEAKKPVPTGPSIFDDR